MFRKPGDTPKITAPEPNSVPEEEKETSETPRDELPEAPETTPDEMIDAEERQKFLPEAAISLSTRMFGRKGGEIMLTIRAAYAHRAFQDLSTALQYAAAIGLSSHPTPGTMPKQAEASSPKPSQPPQEYHVDEMGYQVLKTGTSALNKIVVMPEGGIQFWVGEFKYPFTDKRDPEKVLMLFDARIGMTLEHMTKPAVYTTADWEGVLKVNWHQIQKAEGKKYYNVVQIIQG